MSEWVHRLRSVVRSPWFVRAGWPVVSTESAAVVAGGTCVYVYTHARTDGRTHLGIVDIVKFPLGRFVALATHALERPQLDLPLLEHALHLVQILRATC